MTAERVTSYQVGPDAERDVVPVETLLMKLAMAQAVFEQQGEYIALIEANDGQALGDQLPPDRWAITGAHNALIEVSHALKAGCWGHQAACLH